MKIEYLQSIPEKEAAQDLLILQLKQNLRPHQKKMIAKLTQALQSEVQGKRA